VAVTAPALRARTRAEAEIYLSLVGCSCPEIGLGCDVEVLSWHPQVLRFAGGCPRCGYRREAVIEVAGPPGAEGPETPRGFGDEPSELIDAGQWLAVSWKLARAARELTAGAAGTAQVRATYHRLRLAAAAVDEILKFLLPDTDLVSADGFWTADGMAVREAMPEWFTRERLLALRTQRWRSVTDFADEHDLDDEPTADGTGSDDG
jgi:hypothetical protein